MAWLAATPKPPKGAKRTPQKHSRLEALKIEGVLPPMPPNPLPQLLTWLVEMGISEAAGMGAVPLSWREINAWCARTGVDLTPWQGRTIRQLSAEYLAESRRAESDTCPPPWRAPISRHQVETEVSRLQMVLG